MVSPLLYMHSYRASPMRASFVGFMGAMTIMGKVQDQKNQLGPTCVQNLKSTTSSQTP